MFIIGQTYRRRDDIHGKFGGQQQGEFPRRDRRPMCSCSPAIAVRRSVTGMVGTSAACFATRGRANSGIWHSRGGNQAVRDHAAEGKDLLLFQALGKRSEEHTSELQSLR